MSGRKEIDPKQIAFQKKIIPLETANYLNKIGVAVEADIEGMPKLHPLLNVIIDIEVNARPGTSYGLFTEEARVLFFSKLIQPDGMFVLGGFGGTVQAMNELQKARPELFNRKSYDIIDKNELDRLLKTGQLDLSTEHLTEAY